MTTKLHLRRTTVTEHGCHVAATLEHNATLCQCVEHVTLWTELQLQAPQQEGRRWPPVGMLSASINSYKSVRS